jgi:membrane protease YdiL (CAAX protease family)
MQFAPAVLPTRVEFRLPKAGNIRVMVVGNADLSSPEPTALKARKSRDFAELAVGYALILLVLWTPRPWQRLLYLVAAALIVTAFARSFPGWKAMGLGAANLMRSLWLVPVALLTVGCAVFAANRLHTLHAPDGPGQFFQRYVGYIVFAFVQQMLLQDFFLLRLLRLVRQPVAAAACAAAIFSLAHLPNPILTVATFVWGLIACLFFLRYRSLYALAIAHAILGITLAVTIPGPVIRNMRVGLGYLTYTVHPRHRHSL